MRSRAHGRDGFALTASLLCVALIARGAGWTITLSGLAFAMSLLAVAVAACAERVEPQTETTPVEPAWWPQFERDFAEYVRLSAPREQHGDTGRAS